MMFENDKYIYEGLPASPKIIVEIIFHLYKHNNVAITRQNIANEVFKFHIENSGANGVSNKLGQVKKALADINPLFYKNLRKGYYEFLINDETSFEDFYMIVKKVKKASSLNQIKTLGNNLNTKEGWVYCYYFPSYKELALHKNEKTFPIKIGKTTAEPNGRVSEQSGTALPERPYVFLEIKTLDCSSLEQNIHSLLKLQGVKSMVSVGNEWFVTDEDNILLILKNIENLGVKLDIHNKILLEGISE